MPNELIKLQPSDTAKPDVVFALTSAVGTPLEPTQTILTESLKTRSYQSKLIQLSDLAKLITVPTPLPDKDADEFTRIRALMDRGNEAREISGENSILAAFAISEIIKYRKTSVLAKDKGQAYLLRQLKHHHEAYLLRKVYEEGFHLIGVHGPPAVRLDHLQKVKRISADNAKKLMEDDEYESADQGQKVRDTFHLSDVFVRANSSGAGSEDVTTQIERFLALLFGDGIYTPTRDEYGMFLAFSSGLRSAQLSRQVGAAILTPSGEVLSVGTNEVPKSGGGQYWEGDEPDHRDHKEAKGDSSDYMRREVVAEVLKELLTNWEGSPPAQQEKTLARVLKELKYARITNLTEFGRAVHAEMEAISAAVRVGVSVKGATLYTTTFPCHNCTKHIVAAGIGRVVYIEPYPKSLARDLHGDAISIDEVQEIGTTAKKVRFEAFVGIAPWRYADLFSMVTAEGRIIRRKDENGLPLTNAPGLRIRARDYSYGDVEGRVMEEIRAYFPKVEETTSGTKQGEADTGSTSKK
jgi:deoxycytidylate deaminase